MFEAQVENIMSLGYEVMIRCTDGRYDALAKVNNKTHYRAEGEESIEEALESLAELIDNDLQEADEFIYED